MSRNSIFVSAFAAILLGTTAFCGAQVVDNKRNIVIGEGVEASLNEVGVSNARVVRDGSNVVVDVDIILDDLKVKSTKAVLLTPFLVNGEDSLALPSVGIYGRQRYYYYRRGGSMISGEGESSFMTGKDLGTVPYHAMTAYKEWMNGCRLVLTRSDYSCCEEKTGAQSSDLVSNALWIPGTPALIYVSPKAEKTKARSLSGIAYIDFPVDRTEIHPDYHNNIAELGKIRATIDSVRNDKDITVTSIKLKGFASPEGTYAHNTDLARERTATIRNYVLDLYHFDPSVVTFDYEPENWDGLIAWLRTSGLPHAGEILGIAEDKTSDPDAREYRIRKYYPEDYNVMKSEIYPRLRCTEYRIDYSIRGYVDPQEILRVMRTQPGKLSLEEFFVAAESLESGSPEFNSVFETAAVMYPEDETANLNAASAAMGRGDLGSAEARLAKAGDSAEAEYSRGILAVLRKDYLSAVSHFRDAAGKGMDGAAEQAEIFNEYARSLGLR